MNGAGGESQSPLVLAPLSPVPSFPTSPRRLAILDALCVLERDSELFRTGCPSV